MFLVQILAAQEAQLRQWYALRADLPEPPSEIPAADSDILVATDSEQEVLLETDSGGVSPAQSDHPDEGLMLQTDSDNEVGIQPPAKKRCYTARSSQTLSLSFLGQMVCKHAHARLYGIGANALQNLREGRAASTLTGEERLREPKHPTLGTSMVRDSSRSKWPNVLAFFYLVWISQAEILPTKLRMPNETGLHESPAFKDPDYEERYVRAFMTTLENNFDLNPATRLIILQIWVALTCNLERVSLL